MKRITASQYQISEHYYKLPQLLFESERYKNMKLEVDGAIYLIYSNSNLMALLGCSKSKLLSM